jgi:hypothetical protein
MPDQRQDRGGEEESGTMRTVEIWAKDVEGGDAVAGVVVTSYLRFTDPEEGLEAIVFLGPEAIAKIAAMIGPAVGKGKPN